jgi:hydroxyacylglutathione hydrolase
MADTLTPRAVWEQAHRSFAAVIDLRSPARFGAGHPAGALSVVYSEGGLAERIALVTPESLPVAVIAAEPWQAEGAALQLTTAGRVFLSALPDDPAVWQSAGVPWETLPTVSVLALRGGGNDDRVVLDVREPMEWETGHLPGAILMALGRIRQDLDRLPRDRQIAVICEAGVRSATAASILQAAGFPHVAQVPDGTVTYRALGWPLAFPAIEEVERR